MWKYEIEAFVFITFPIFSTRNLQKFVLSLSTYVIRLSCAPGPGDPESLTAWPFAGQVCGPLG